MLFQHCFLLHAKKRWNQRIEKVFRMRTRKVIAEIGVAESLQPEIPHIQAIYDSLETHGLNPGSKQERKKGSKGQVVNASTVANLYESYMPQKGKLGKKVLNTRSPEDLLAIIKPLIAKVVLGPAYLTWIEPLQAVKYDKKRLVLKAASKFNQEQILNRYRRSLESLVSELTDAAIVGIDILVDESMAVKTPPTPAPEALAVKLIDRRNQWGMQQNPTDNPDVDALLRKHGDMRLTFQKCGLFDAPLKPAVKGGWNLRFDSLMSHGNQYGLERVLWAVLYVMQELKRDRSITNPGGVFYHAVKNGKKPESMAALRAYL
jgi:hypothetical protein